MFQWIGAAYYLLAGVLAGNLFEAWRRVQVHRHRAGRARAATTTRTKVAPTPMEAGASAPAGPPVLT